MVHDMLFDDGHGGRIDRREFVRRAAAAGVSVSPLAGLLASACGRDDGGETEPRDFEARYREALLRAREAGPPATEIRLVAEPGEFRLAADRSWSTWLYSGQYPGPEIRITRG